VTPDRTVFTLDYADEELASRIERSLRPEIGDIDGDRTTAELAREGATLRVTVAADDLVALRAGCNTWLTLASVAEAASQH
jgi:KEOPS complex subunit Pcc1